ncbi:RluA family pseudouridine synthase [Candidatus Peregrinibacteria bacterium]|nr:RluA family pseudouridine synthase [Candidatus Peregrinibacteria bacterium]
MRHYKVTSAEDGMRLDQYMAKMEPMMTRAFIQKMIKGGSIFINHKKTLKPACKVREDEELLVVVPSIKEIGIVAENIPIHIIYEDKDIVVVNKPPNMVSHPTDYGAHVSGTLVNAVMYHCKNLSGIGGERRPGIVHRLDKDTSGLMIVAKNDAAHHNLSKQIEERKVVKKYVALLKGHLKPEEGSIEAPLLKTEGKKNEVKISNRKGAKYALTHYKVKKYIKDYTLVEVQIITGRTHQIRVHFASIGHPVCGDKVYGDHELNEKLRDKSGLSRQFLHAEYLKFRLPKNNEFIELKAPMPNELKIVLKNLI